MRQPLIVVQGRRPEAFRGSPMIVRSAGVTIIVIRTTLTVI